MFYGQCQQGEVNVMQCTNKLLLVFVSYVRFFTPKVLTEGCRNYALCMKHMSGTRIGKDGNKHVNCLCVMFKFYRRFTYKIWILHVAYIDI